MAEHQRRILRSSTGVALATVLSRVLGLGRVMLESRILGGGLLATGWMLAFAIPNLFRRLLGEGALGTALVPIVSHSISDKGRDHARKELTVILAVLGSVLAVLVIIIAAAAYFVAPYVVTPRYLLPLQALPVMIPYAFFICLTGAIGAVLNSIKKFVAPALTALLLNIILISCLVFVIYPAGEATGLWKLRALSIAVLISGAVQLLIMFGFLAKAGMMPKLCMKDINGKAVISELWRLTLPGIIGASAVQISFLIDRLLACWLSDYAVPALTYSDRIIYLPIGVFAVSFGGVSLAMFSSSAAKNDIAEMISSLTFSLRHLLFICVPLAVFIVVFRYPVIRVICFGGKFGGKALDETAWAMLFYAFGIPAFAAIKITVNGFYARKKMKTPVRVSIFCIVVNIILNLILMWPLKQGGIALSTVIASILNNSILLYLLRKDLGKFPLMPVLRCLLVSIVISLIAVLAAYYTFNAFAGFQLHPAAPADLLPLLVCGSVFCLLYLILGFCCRCREIPELTGIFFRKR